MSENYFQKLVDLMARLRGPDGCPWDHEQTRETLKPMLIEEAFELLEALDKEDAEEICEELGDLLFQVVFHSQIAREKGEFDAHDVCRCVYEKMVRRHPHVFGDRSFADSRDLLRNWEDLKAAEKEASGRPQRRKSVLDGIPETLPTLYRSHQLTSKAARVGFDWPDLDGIHSQYKEEFRELKLALETGDEEHVREEVGDLIFTVLNLARFLEIDPETALRRANRKFKRRFQRMERYFESRQQTLKEVEPAAMEEFWQNSKTGPRPRP
jgi:MazG family protein